jgi:hypothetical protein
MIALISFMGVWLLNFASFSGGDRSSQYAETVPIAGIGQIRVMAPMRRTSVERRGSRPARPWCAQEVQA